MTWIPGAVNPADVLTKFRSTIVSPVQLMLFTGELPVDFTKAKNRCAEASTE